MQTINDTKIIRVANSQVAGTTAVNSSLVSTANAKSFEFDAIFGDVTDASVLGLKIQGGEESNGSDMADLTGASVSFTADATSGDNKILRIAIERPLNTYLRAVVTRTVANAVVDGVICLVSDGRSVPVTDDASVVGNGGAIASPSQV